MIQLFPMVSSALDGIGIELMKSVRGDELTVNGTDLEVTGTGYYTGVTGTGDTIPHLYQFRAVDDNGTHYTVEVRWDMSDTSDQVGEATIREGRSMLWEDIDSMAINNRVDSRLRPTEERLNELYREAKEEYEEGN